MKLFNELILLLLPICDVVKLTLSGSSVSGYSVVVLSAASSSISSISSDEVCGNSLMLSSMSSPTVICSPESSLEVGFNVVSLTCSVEKNSSLDESSVVKISDKVECSIGGVSVTTFVPIVVVTTFDSSVASTDD